MNSQSPFRKLWQGDAKFWQAFWVVGLGIIAVAFAVTTYMGRNLQPNTQNLINMTGIAILYALALVGWGIIVLRNRKHARWRASYWVAMLVVVLLFMQALLNVVFSIMIMPMARDGDRMEAQIEACMQAYDGQHPQDPREVMSPQRQEFLMQCVKPDAEARRKEKLKETGHE